MVQCNMLGYLKSKVKLKEPLSLIIAKQNFIHFTHNEHPGASGYINYTVFLCILISRKPKKEKQDKLKLGDKVGKG